MGNLNFTKSNRIEIFLGLNLVTFVLPLESYCRCLVQVVTKVDFADTVSTFYLDPVQTFEQM